MVADKFSADSKLIGYFYQVRYALYLLLKEKEDDNISIAIENLDDVDFEQNGEPIELIQFKHHLKRTGNLGDRSPDIWKTIRIWAIRIKDKIVDPAKTRLLLITTGIASENSIAWQLKKCCKTETDVTSVMKSLSQIATESNKTNKEAYDAFLDLEIEERKKLIEAIIIVDNAPTLVDLESNIRKELRNSIHPTQLSAFAERLEGWWFTRSIKALWDQATDSGDRRTIGRNELDIVIRDIRDDYRKGALPNDYSGIIPPQGDKVWDPENKFLKQLDLIKAEKRKEKAIFDYYRAYNQRSQWLRENFIEYTKLELFDDNLYEEWSEKFYIMKEDLEFEENTEMSKIKKGRELYNWVSQDAHCLILIRPDWTDPYLVRGSYHMLADSEKPKVGWHPDFEIRLYGGKKVEKIVGG